MGLFRRISVAMLVALVCAPLRADAQTLSGTLIGTVKDAEGGVIPGATIRITSPALIGGERAVTTSERGQWRLPILPPGEYSLVVELTPQFNVHRQESIRIGAGETIDLTVVLQVAGIAESVVVPGNTGINRRTSGLESRFGPEFIRLVPTRRYSMFSLINNTPGVSPTSPASGAINTVSVFGSAVNENAFLIDGTNFTCPCQGVSRAEPIMDVIQELHVQSIGASVEFGNMQGGVFNVITKQGGAQFANETSYYAQTAGLTAQPIVLPVRAGTQPESGYERVRYRDFTTSVGGPVWRDRLWFFSAYQYLRDYDSQPGADPAYPRRYEQNKVFGKLNWQLSPSLQMMQSFHQERWVNPTPATLAAPFATTQRVHASVPNTTFAHVTHIVSNRTFWEARAGRFLLRQDTDPSSGDRTTPSRSDQITGLSSGNTSLISTLHLDRTTAKFVLHRYQSDWFGSDHEFKVGAQIERGEHRLLQILPGGVRYIDNNGAPFQAVYRTPTIAGGVFIMPAAFFSDRFSLSDRITVDAGVRFDYSRAINPELPVVSPDGRETDATIPGIGTVYTQNMMSPRLGLTASLDGSGRTVFRASYGRFYQGVLTGEIDSISQGTTPTVTRAFESATGDYTRLVSVVDPKINLALDPNTRSPRTDEFSLALDREVTPRVRASVAYIRKQGRDFIGWIDTAGRYREDIRTVGGLTVPAFILTNATSDRRFFLTNPDTLFVNYDGLVAAVEARRSDDWRVSGSYTFSRAYGRQATSNGAAEDPQFSTIARPSFLTFGQDPNDMTNSAGRLPNDRPHAIRATSVMRVPWQGILIAANLQIFSGKPWAATTQLSLPQGSRRVLLEPRGARRLSSQALLDLRVSKTVAIGSAARVDLLLDVLNLLGDSAEEALVSDNLSAETFGRPRLYIDPRRAMLGVRLNLGR